MANTVLLKRSAVAGRAPVAADLVLGELAVNVTDGKLYLKKSASGVESIVDVTAGGMTNAELFAKVEKVVATYQPYCLLGMYEGNLDDLVEEQVKDASDYDNAYKGLRQRRKEAEKLPNFEKVDCLNISLAPLKSALEDQHQRLSDALQLGMVRQATATQRELSEFISKSLEHLSKRPQSLDEI